MERLRRLRRTAAIRDLVRENHVRADDLVYPLFVAAGNDSVTPVESMPGVSQYTVDRLGEVIDRVVSAGVKAVLLFGIPDHKDEQGSGAWDEAVGWRTAAHCHCTQHTEQSESDYCRRADG